MSNNLSLQVKLDAIDKMSQPLRMAVANVQKLAKNIQELEAQKKKLSEQQKLIDSFKQLKAADGELATKLKEAQSKAQALAKQLNATSNPTKKLQQDFERASKSVNKLKTEQAQHLEKLQKVRSQLKESGISTKTLGATQSELSHKLKLTNEQIDKQKQRLEKLNTSQKKYRQSVEKLKSNSERFANFGQKSLVAGAATTGLLAKPTQEFAAAENAATQLKVAMMDNTGKVSDNFEKINKLATDLGNRLPGTTADFQNLMTMLVRQGMSAESILGGTGEAAAYLSVQLGMAPEKAAEFAAKMQDATRSSEKDMLGLMDVIQKAFYAGVDPTNMLGAFSDVAGAMDIIKLKGLGGAKALAPLIAQLDQASLSGSAAGNALRKIFTKSMDVTNIAKQLKDLKEVDLVPKNFKLDFTDGKGSFGGLPKMFKELQKLNQLSDTARLKVIKSIFGDDAEVNKALTNIIERGQAGYDEFAAKMEKQASLQQRVNAQLQTLTNIWDSASGTFTNLLASIGETLAPQLKALAEGFGNVAEKIMVWVKANPELTGIIVKSIAVLGGLMTAIGALSLVFSYTLYPVMRFFLFVGNLFSKLSVVLPILKLVGSAIFAMGKAMLFNPITWIIAGIVALGAAIYLLWKNWDTVVAKFKQGWSIVSNTVSQVWGNLTSSLAQYWDSIVERFKQGWNSLISAISEVWNSFINTLSQWWTNIKQIFDENPILNFLFPIVPVVRGIIAIFQNWEQISQTIMNAIRSGWEALSNAAKPIFEAIGKAMDIVLSPLQSIKDGVQWLLDNLSKLSFDGLANAAKGIGNAVGNKAKEIGNGIAEGAKSAWGAVSGFFGGEENAKATPLKGHARGGFTGAGGKYDPAGIVHRGEYVMTKEATARLGVANLNRLNYGGVGGLAAVAAMASGVALAQPMAVKVDNRPLLSAPVPKVASGAVAQNITITINASPNQSEREIARLVQQELAKAQLQAQARNRSSLRDRG